MSECLGLYIENNLIKYAKVEKEKENIKVEAHGLKFFDNLEDTIEQIIRETYSFKTPISVNIANEKYTVANLFSLLNTNDLNKAIGTEFDYFCSESGKNRNAIEFRHMKAQNIEDKDKIRVLYAYVEKANIVERLQALDAYKTSTLTPIATAIANLAKEPDTKNSIIVNLEGKTTITILSDGKPYTIEVLEDGMEKIIKNIAERENSYSKAYEICKNTTIYTRAGQNLQLEENDYLDEIMPTLYNIIEKTQDIIQKSQIDVNNIYITGTGAIINNIDLYFQENFMNKKCEILTPFFIERTNIKLNIKDYIEVNSAIAIALEGLKSNSENPINFTNRSIVSEKLKQLMKMDIKDISIKKPTQKKKVFSPKEMLSFDLKSDLDWIEAYLLRGIAGILMAIVIYSGAVIFINREINVKMDEATELIEDTQTKMGKIAEYTTLVNKKTEQYTSLLSKIEEKENNQSEHNSRKNAIPNMLNQIMFAVPEEVQIISMENTVDKTVEFHKNTTLTANQYQQLGYFKAAIQNDNILVNVTSTSGTYSNGIITVEITGELPY